MRGSGWKQTVLAGLVLLCVPAVGLAETEAYLGVTTWPVGRVTASQLNLPEGMGLVVARLVPGGPAEGILEENDVLLLFEDQQLYNWEQLVALVQAQKPGADVKLTISRQGERRKVTVELGEREAGRRAAGEEGTDKPSWVDNEVADEALSRLRTDYGEHWEKVAKDVLGAIVRAIKIIEQSVDGENTHAADEAAELAYTPPKATIAPPVLSRAQMRDGAVMVIMSKGSRNYLGIKDKDGKVVFEGPIDTEEEQAKVPAAYRRALDELTGAAADLAPEEK